MARFNLTAAHVFGATRVKAGRNIADTQGNAQPGDFVFTGLSSSTVTADMVPLDGAATTMKNASRYASVAAKSYITGVDSIDA
jgi:hypothetical protein